MHTCTRTDACRIHKLSLLLQLGYSRTVDFAPLVCTMFSRQFMLQLLKGGHSVTATEAELGVLLNTLNHSVVFQPAAVVGII
jgi:hypothetical protein